MKEAGQLLSVSERQVQYLIADGEIQSFKFGKLRRISRKAIEEFIAAKSAASRAA